jgi:hypothetical protein
MNRESGNWLDASLRKQNRENISSRMLVTI